MALTIADPQLVPDSVPPPLTQTHTEPSPASVQRHSCPNSLASHPQLLHASPPPSIITPSITPSHPTPSSPSSLLLLTSTTNQSLYLLPEGLFEQVAVRVDTVFCSRAPVNYKFSIIKVRGGGVYCMCVCVCVCILTFHWSSRERVLGGNSWLNSE